MHSNHIGPSHAGVSLTGSVHQPGVGLNVGFQIISVGVARGDVAAQRGPTSELNWGVGFVGGTITFSNGSFAGASVGLGETLTLVGLSYSESGTAVMTGQDAIDAVRDMKNHSDQ
jgi:hypothetical protein